MDKSPQLSSHDYRVVLTKAVLNAQQLMGLSKTALARVLGISPASVTRMAGGQFLLGTDSKEWELATLLVRLYRGLDAIMAGDEAAMRGWLTHHNHDLDGQPDQLIHHITGLVDCVAYVDAFRARV
ncbi:MAG: antitoxin Xre-like helix-turn-helix domain-containing protein [Pseudomonadota bacterium]